MTLEVQPKWIFCKTQNFQNTTQNFQDTQNIGNLPEKETLATGQTQRPIEEVTVLNPTHLLESPVSDLHVNTIEVLLETDFGALRCYFVPNDPEYEGLYVVVMTENEKWPTEEEDLSKMKHKLASIGTKLDNSWSVEELLELVRYDNNISKYSLIINPCKIESKEPVRWWNSKKTNQLIASQNQTIQNRSIQNQVARLAEKWKSNFKDARITAVHYIKCPGDQYDALEGLYPEKYLTLD